MVYNVSRKTQYVSLFGLSVLKYAEYPTAYYTQRLNIVTEQESSVPVKREEHRNGNGIRHAQQSRRAVHVTEHNHYRRYEHERHDGNEGKNFQLFHLNLL